MCYLNELDGYGLENGTTFTEFPKFLVLIDVLIFQIYALTFFASATKS